MGSKRGFKQTNSPPQQFGCTKFATKFYYYGLVIRSMKVKLARKKAC